MTRLYYPTGPGRAFHPLSQEEALRLFHYNHPEGSLHWKEKKVGRYMKPVGALKSPYPRVRVGKHLYYVSRVIFLMHHGWLPDSILHFDGNPHNNQIQNLRVNDGIGSWPLKIPKGRGQEKRGKEDSNRDFDPQGARTGEEREGGLKS